MLLYGRADPRGNALRAAGGDVCWNEAARLRVQKIYEYYTNAETLARLVRHLAA